jgi:hypothetical protein
MYNIVSFFGGGSLNGNLFGRHAHILTLIYHHTGKHAATIRSSIDRSRLIYVWGCVLSRSLLVFSGAWLGWMDGCTHVCVSVCVCVCVFVCMAEISNEAKRERSTLGSTCDGMTTQCIVFVPCVWWYIVFFFSSTGVYMFQYFNKTLRVSSSLPCHPP